MHLIFLPDIVGLENLQDQCLAQLKLRTLKGFSGMKLTIDIETEMIKDREVTRYFMPTGNKLHYSKVSNVSKGLNKVRKF